MMWSAPVTLVWKLNELRFMSIFVNFRSHPVILNGRLKISGEGEGTLLEVYIESRCVLWYNGSKG